MNKYLNKIAVTVLLLIGSQSFAHAPKCSDIFGPSIEALLEKAGQLEFDLTNRLILRSDNSPEVQTESQRLEQVQTLIEDIFANAGSEEDLVVLSKRLEQLTQKKEVIEASSTLTPRLTNIVESKNARKDFDGLQNYLKEKYNKFLDEISRARSLTDLSPNWALERIDVFEITREPTYSIRLNQGYRVLFVYESSSGVKILRISMKVTH